MHVKVKCPICGLEHSLIFNISLIENREIVQDVLCPYTNEFYTIIFSIKVKRKGFTKEELYLAELENKIWESKWRQEEENV